MCNHATQPLSKARVFAEARIEQVDHGNAHLAATVATYNTVLDQAAETALIFDSFAQGLRQVIFDAESDQDGALTDAGGLTVNLWLRGAWPALWTSWLDGDEDAGYVGFRQRQRDAVQHAIDAHRVQHAYYFEPFRQAASAEALFGGVVPTPDAPPFDAQLDVIVDMADRRLVGSPPYTWSQRIWQYQNGGLNDMTRLITRAIADKTGAWQLAADLENFLGVGQQWPRWAARRLFRMTPKSRALSTAGLIRFPGPMTGVSYKALRLARTEIQAIHNMATDAFMASAPWIDQEQINRSPSATACPICDPVAGVAGGDGVVYKKGTIALPLHPNCMCFKTAVMMARDLFVTNVRGWLRGENAFLDDYQPFMQDDEALMAGFTQILNQMGWQMSLPFAS